MIEPDRRNWVALGVGGVVSLLVHVSVALALNAPARGTASEQESEPPAQPPKPDQQPLVLGRIDTDRASIAWLGVERDEREADAPLSEVDQAALSPAPGPAPTEQPVPAPAPMPEAEPIEAQPLTPPTESPPEPPVEPAQEEPVPEPAQPEPVEIAEPEPAPPESAPPEEVEADPLPEGPAIIAEPTPPQPEPEPEPQPVETPVDEPAPAEIMGPPAPPADRPVPQEALPNPAQPTQQPAEPTQTDPAPPAEPEPGEVAEMSDRQVDAARREAIDYDTDTNRPRASEGLEIKTFRPDWSIIARQSYLPRNPIVLIRFGRDGKVRRAEFLREPNGAKGTGIPAIDGPIIDAVYRWTAKGARIDAIEGDGHITVPIRIVLSSRG